MTSRLLDLLLILSELHDKDKSSLRDLGRELVLMGYTPEEIDQAFSLMHAGRVTHEQDGPILNDRAGQRILAEWERISLGEESQRYLLQLLNAGIIDHLQMEQILERAVPFSFGKIEMEDIKTIAFSVIFNLRPHDFGEDEFEELDDKFDLN